MFCCINYTLQGKAINYQEYHFKLFSALPVENGCVSTYMHACVCVSALACTCAWVQVIVHWRLQASVRASLRSFVHSRVCTLRTLDRYFIKRFLSQFITCANILLSYFKSLWHVMIESNFPFSNCSGQKVSSTAVGIWFLPAGQTNSICKLPECLCNNIYLVFPSMSSEMIIINNNTMIIY